MPSEIVVANGSFPPKESVCLRICAHIQVFKVAFILFVAQLVPTLNTYGFLYGNDLT